MQIRKCDKCKKEIIEHPMQQAILPRYYILAMYQGNKHISIDLCDSCQRRFETWLNSEKENADADSEDKE